MGWARSSWTAAALCAVLFAFAARAQGPVLSRPPLLQERLTPEARHGEVQVQLLWPRALRDLGLQVDAPDGRRTNRSSCFYPTALETLRRLRRELGATHAYPKVWARNQDRVFSACDHRAAGTTAPALPSAPGLPKRTRSDFDYQLGSWHFYRQEYESALPLFEKLSRQRAAPQRANAAYMVVRTLAYLKRLDDAYAAIDRVLADNTLREVHGIAANYRFVIMSNSNDIAALGAMAASPALARRHLQWLHDTMLADPDRATDPTQAAADAKDAREQMASYFPLHDQAGRLDWWLQEDEPEGPRMQAVKALARKLPLIDWMQANWASNIFDVDWLWALHDADNPAWKGHNAIVAHAWQRWQLERNGAWLQVAVRRAHPTDPLARDILVAALAHLAHPWSRPQEEESIEYAHWVFSLWENAVRLHLGMGETDQAIALLARGPQTLRDIDRFERQPPFAPPLNHPAATVERALRWLVYRGEVQEARALLAAVQPQFPHALRQWRSLLATSVAEAHAAAQLSRGHTMADYIGNLRAGWESLLDDLSSDALFHLASGSEILPGYRALMARTALARALILHYDDAVVDRYAALAARLNPSIRETLLAGVAPHSRSAYASLLLQSPRLRPAVFAEYAVVSSDMQRTELAPDAIDGLNRNDNNWWCAYAPEQIRERAFKAWRIAPLGGRLFGGKDMDREIAPYLARQREVLDGHPYRMLVNPLELQALAAVPSGPRFLAEAVIEREIATTDEPSPEDRNARAADLHRAVRTTRYGCHRDGSHADYSRGAFKLLHERYGDTPWAKATPYWFK